VAVTAWRCAAFEEIPMTRVEQIQNVLKKRKPLVGSIVKVIKAITEIAGVCGKIQDECRRARGNFAIGRKASLGKMESLCQDVVDDIEHYKKKTQPLLARLGRDTINIGVLGEIGSGKSTLLQSITGLGGNVIPATTGTDSFTSTKSVIAHHDEKSEAVVSYYTERELITEVLQPSLDRLSINHAIQSLSDFEDLQLPENVHDNRKVLQQLKYYQTDECKKIYKELIGEKPQLLKNLADVGKFLTYWKVDGATNAAKANRQLQLQWQWMATREVRIKTPFKCSDVGSIALIDMPGFGDTQAGNESRLVRALEEDVDIALYVFKPQPHRASLTHVSEHFAIAKKALSHSLPFKQWSFVLFNCLNSSDSSVDTTGQCSELAEKMHENDVDAVGALICNVTKQDEVRKTVLDPILNYLSENVAKMDLQFAQDAQREARLLQRRITEALVQLRDWYNDAFGNADVDSLLTLKSSALVADFTDSLVSYLYQTVWATRQEEDASYKDLVVKCVGIAKEVKVDRDQLRLQSYSGSLREASFRTLHDLRMRVGAAFQPIYSEPCAAILAMREKIAGFLCEQGGFGRLQRVACATDKLEEIATVLRKFRGVGVERAVELVLRFDVSSGSLLPLIGGHLEKLDPEFAKSTDLMVIVDSDHSFIDVKKVDSAAQAMEGLVDSVVDAIKAELDKHNKQPTFMAVYLLAEFVYRAVRGNSRDVEWRKVHNGLREELWPQEFGSLAEVKALGGAIESALNSLEVSSESVGFRFAV
jgi:energy-coupling factor transporter ATP-binding protein EcfA2